ncbi:MAG: hypothetical protein EOP11_10165 [Proteobacteria bacterium]|nr:MAG: hypothetical protein EOP11_10165 [Pseudomonadota bacterium]
MLLTTLSFPMLALAAVFLGEGDAGGLEGVKTPAKGRVEIQGRASNVSSVGLGLRYKKVVFVKAKVYVGQLFLSEPSTFKKTKAEALGSLAQSKVAVMQMHFLRNVDAPTVQEAFRDSFKENKIALEQEAIQKFLTAVKAGGPAVEGKALTVIGEKIGARELVTYEGTDGKPVTIEGGEGFRKEIFALWLGEPTDSGVENLQEGLLK